MPAEKELGILAIWLERKLDDASCFKGACPVHTDVWMYGCITHTGQYRLQFHISSSIACYSWKLSSP